MQPYKRQKEEKMNEQHKENYYQAYEQGYTDFINRQAMFVSENPFKEFSLKAKAWENGFNDADNFELSQERQYDRFDSDSL